MAATPTATKSGPRTRDAASGSAAKPPAKRMRAGGTAINLNQRQQVLPRSEPAAAEPVINDFLDTLDLMERTAIKLKGVPLKTVLDYLKAQPSSKARERQRSLVLRRVRRMAATVDSIQSKLEPHLVEEQSPEETAAFLHALQDEADASLQEMVAAKELVSGADLAERLGCSPQALSKALGARRMFYVEFRGTRYFPAWLADPRFDRKHVEAVSKVLGDLPGGAKLAFFTNPLGSLAGQTPLEALAGGKLERVLNAAQAYVQA